MHSRKKGKSGSTRPARLEKPVWVELSSEEVENEVVKLARKGFSQSLIGVILRDSYGVPLVKVVTGKSINQILKWGIFFGSSYICLKIFKILYQYFCIKLAEQW